MEGHQRTVHRRCQYEEQARREHEQGRGRPVLQLERAWKALGYKVGWTEPQLPERMARSDGMVSGEEELKAFFSDDAHPRSRGRDETPPSPCLPGPIYMQFPLFFGQQVRLMRIAAARATGWHTEWR